MNTLTLEDCRSIIHKICPELQDVYLVENDTLVAPERAPAWCVRGPHLGLRDLLKEQGTWHGWTTGFIVFTEPPTLAVLLHELAHLLPARAISLPDDEEPTDEQRKLQEAQTAAWTREPRPATVPWSGHDLRFIRHALHLFYRVTQAYGDDALRLWDVRAADEDYGLQSSLWDYRLRLAHEPQQSLRKSFDEIAAEDPPDPFLRLFAKDVRFWFSYLAHKEIEKCLPTNNSTTA